MFNDNLCRGDVRLDGKGNPFILDINSPPGVIPPEVSIASYIPLEARTAGLDYVMLIQAVIGYSLWGYGNEYKRCNLSRQMSALFLSIK